MRIKVFLTKGKIMMRKQFLIVQLSRNVKKKEKENKFITNDNFDLQINVYLQFF